MFHFAKDAPKGTGLLGWGYLMGLFNLKEFRELLSHSSLKNTLTENFQISL